MSHIKCRMRPRPRPHQLLLQLISGEKAVTAEQLEAVCSNPRPPTTATNINNVNTVLRPAAFLMYPRLVNSGGDIVNVSKYSI